MYSIHKMPVAAVDTEQKSSLVWYSNKMIAPQKKN